MKQLIINADDFGLNEDVNEGIKEAFRAGAITGATLMVKREGAEDAVRFALENPGPDVGLHLDLDEILGGDVKGPERFSGKKLSGMLKDSALLRQVEDEIEEQIRLFRETSLPFTHIDGHHHLHALPEIFPVVLRKMVEHGIKTVRFSRSYDLVKYPPIEWDETTYDEMNDLLKGKGITKVDHFVAACSLETLKNLGVGVTELMVHPGVKEDWRKRELEMIMSEEWKSQLARNGIRLVSFKDLAAPFYY